MAETTATVGGSLLVALLFPKAAEKIFAVTGATVVCIVCYVVPVFIHFHMYRCQRRDRHLPLPVQQQLQQEREEWEGQEQDGWQDRSLRSHPSEHEEGWGQSRAEVWRGQRGPA